MSLYYTPKNTIAAAYESSLFLILSLLTLSVVPGRELPRVGRQRETDSRVVHCAHSGVLITQLWLPKALSLIVYSLKGQSVVFILNWLA